MLFNQIDQKKSTTGIRDNFSNGKVGDFLKEYITAGSELSFVTAYFTIYAYEKLKPQLDNINSLRLLFGEPRFIKNVSSSIDAKNYQIEDDKLVIPVENRLQQKVLAKQCANWIREKVEIKSMIRPDFLHGKLYHIEKPNGVEDAVTGKFEPIQHLCDLFNEETNNGSDISQYTILLHEAIRSISGTFKKKNLGMLTGNRNATLVSQEKQADGANKFELITWLILK